MDARKSLTFSPNIASLVLFFLLFSHSLFFPPPSPPSLSGIRCNFLEKFPCFESTLLFPRGPQRDDLSIRVGEPVDTRDGTSRLLLSIPGRSCAIVYRGNLFSAESTDRSMQKNNGGSGTTQLIHETLSPFLSLSLFRFPEILVEYSRIMERREIYRCGRRKFNAAHRKE